MAGRGEDARGLFTRRALVLSGAGVAAFGALTARLYKLQILESDRYRGLSDENQFNYQLLPPSRGQILDRDGVPLAKNADNFRLLLEPEQVPDLDDLLARLSKIIPLRNDMHERIRKSLKRRSKSTAVVLAENLDWAQFAAANLQLPELPGVRPEVGELRIYPDGASMAHVIGYVGRVPESMDTEDEPLLRHPGFRIGRTGAEKALDKKLRGHAGALKVEVSALGRVVRELPDPATIARPGDDVELTLDQRVQSFAAARLKGQSAAVCAIDIDTGAVPVLLSTPGFDPNLFAKGISGPDYRSLLEDEFKPLFNKALGGTYPPASCIKPVIAVTALRQGITDGHERVLCTGKIKLGDREFHCWKRSGHGPVNMLGAIGKSCDIYFYEMARRLGIDNIRDAVHEFGFGENFDLGIGGGNTGLVPDQAWKRARFGTSWSQGETLIAGIGQGYLATTPIQLAVMTARLASGVKVMPYLIKGEEQHGFGELGFSTAGLGAARAGMIAVCEAPWGTAYRMGGLGLGDLKMAGKTGTGQVRRITKVERDDRVRKNSELPWRLRDHALFVTYAPADAPRYAVAVVVEHGGGGSVVAAPPARDILRELLREDPATLARLSGVGTSAKGPAT
ncbi:MAG: penicillin-binding protein 2 [Robiginitomaculum sp.]|nr:MAG: penicillin-binding protein 2 [Robiginitomaculum sp.]